MPPARASYSPAVSGCRYSRYFTSRKHGTRSRVDRQKSSIYKTIALKPLLWPPPRSKKEPRTPSKAKVVPEEKVSPPELSGPARFPEPTRSTPRMAEVLRACGIAAANLFVARSTAEADPATFTARLVTE